MKPGKILMGLAVVFLLAAFVLDIADQVQAGHGFHFRILHAGVYLLIMSLLTSRREKSNSDTTTAGHICCGSEGKEMKLRQALIILLGLSLCALFMDLVTPRLGSGFGGGHHYLINSTIIGFWFFGWFCIMGATFMLLKISKMK